jgi:hypothetical protein
MLSREKEKERVFFPVIRAITRGQLREFLCLPVLRFPNMKVIIDLLKEEIHMDTQTQREYKRKNASMRRRGN